MSLNNYAPSGVLSLFLLDVYSVQVRRVQIKSAIQTGHRLLMYQKICIHQNLPKFLKVVCKDAI